MALQSIGGAFPWPSIPTNTLTTLSLNSNTIDASGEKFACIFHVPKTGTLERIGIKFGSVTTAQDIKVSFQDLDLTTGHPDETVDQFRVIPSASISALAFVETGIITSDGTDGGSKRSVTVGDRLAVVFEFDSTVGNLGITNCGDSTNNMPYTNHATGGSWAKDQDAPVMVVKYDDGTYVFCAEIYPYNDLGASSAFNTGTTPDEIGNIIRVPFKCRVNGAWFWGDLDGDATIILYDSDGSTVLSSLALDKDVRSTANSDTHFIAFAPVTLSPNTDYRLTLRPDSATSLTIERFTVTSASLLDAVPGGQNIRRTHRTDAGSWTQTATERIMIGVMIDQLSDDAGSGGGGPGPGVFRAGNVVQPIY